MVKLEICNGVENLIDAKNVFFCLIYSEKSVKK